MSIRLRLNLILIGALLVLGIATIALSYVIEARRAQAEIDHDASLLIALASATRSYTTDDIQPLVPAVEQGAFHPQIVPAFAAQKIFSKIREEFPGFIYREAVLNPTNRVDLSNTWETAVIKEFRDDPARTSAQGLIDADGQTMYFLAKPITITDKACLACHSTPQAAPANMVSIYGTENGFGWRLGETVGAQFITVPASTAYGRALASVTRYAISLLAIFAVLVMIVNLLLDRLVVAPLRRISGAADRFASGDLSEPDLREGRTDEIGTLESSLRRVWRSFHALLRNGRPDQTDTRT